MQKVIKITDPEETKLLAELGKRTDAEAARMRRFLAMPDLSRRAGSPIREIVEKVVAIPDFKDFYVFEVPEIVSAKISVNFGNHISFQ